MPFSNHPNHAACDEMLGADRPRTSIWARNRQRANGADAASIMGNAPIGNSANATYPILRDFLTTAITVFSLIPTSSTIQLLLRPSATARRTHRARQLDLGRQPRWPGAPKGSSPCYLYDLFGLFSARRNDSEEPRVETGWFRCNDGCCGCRRLRPMKL